MIYLAANLTNVKADDKEKDQLMTIFKLLTQEMEDIVMPECEI